MKSFLTFFVISLFLSNFSSFSYAEVEKSDFMERAFDKKPEESVRFHNRRLTGTKLIAAGVTTFLMSSIFPYVTAGIQVERFWPMLIPGGSIFFDYKSIGGWEGFLWFSWAWPMYIASGIVQLVGLGLLIAGLVMYFQHPHKKASQEKEKSHFSMMVVPQVGPSRVGVGLVGEF
ncbi:MAG: hypothetical protein H6728_07435 [Myxococcales bacterium]|nr:hypothetical protein [Myxococcales bacterium]